MPIKLQNIRIDLLKDDWTQLESIEDQAVCVEGIFEFLKRLSDQRQQPEERKKLTFVQLRRMISFRLGLVHFFASLMQSLSEAAGSDGVDLEGQCLTIMAECFPAELSTSQLTKLDPSATQ